MDEWASPPSLEDVKAYRDQLIADWTSGEDGEDSLDAGMQREEDLYFQKFEVNHPEGRRPLKTGSAPSDCDATVDSLIPDDILIKVRPVRGKEKYKKQQEKLARLGKALLFAWRRKKDVLRLVASDMTIRRVGVARVLVDRQKWPALPPELQADDADPEEIEEWEAMNRRQCPIVLEPRNPRYVRWEEDDQGRLLVVAEHYPTTVLRARQELGFYRNTHRILKDKDPADTVWISDVWIGPYRCILIEDEPVFPGSGKAKGVLPHLYSEIPYVITPFRELHFENPGQRYRGMLTNAADLYPAESEGLTAHMEMLFWNSYRTWLGWFPDQRDITVKPGQYIRVNKNRGEYLEMMKGEPVPPELLQTVGVIGGFLQQNSTAQGPRTADSTRSAQQVFAIQSLRQVKLGSPKGALQRFVERALTLATMEIEQNLEGEKLTLPVPGRDKDGQDLGEVVIRPKDINGYWDGYIAVFDKRLDPAQLEQGKAVMAFSQNKWMPRRVSWELSGLTDAPQEWEDDLLLEAIDSTDIMIEAAALKRIENWYGKDSEEYAMFFSKIAQSKAQGIQPMGPGVPTGGSMQPSGPARGPDSLGGSGLGAMVRSNSTGGGANNMPRR
jgi:hypothetical protein